VLKILLSASFSVFLISSYLQCDSSKRSWKSEPSNLTLSVFDWTRVRWRWALYRHWCILFDLDNLPCTRSPSSAKPASKAVSSVPVNTHEHTDRPQIALHPLLFMFIPLLFNPFSVILSFTFDRAGCTPSLCLDLERAGAVFYIFRSTPHAALPMYSLHQSPISFRTVGIIYHMVRQPTSSTAIHYFGVRVTFLYVLCISYLSFLDLCDPLWLFRTPLFPFISSPYVAVPVKPYLNLSRK
jgi:hypothetical protein